jgi:glycosyltransferase involved in cell wall biosynthesis
MKVLNVNVSLDPVTGGGTAERTFQMSRALADSGIECTILTTNIGLTPSRIKQLVGVKIIALPCLFERFFIVSFSWSQLRSLVKQADIVHLMGHWSMLNALISILAMQSRTPYVVCPAGELLLFGRSYWIKSLFNRIIGYRIIRNAAGCIAVTPDELPIFRDYGAKSDVVTVIPNGVNEADFNTEAEDGFSIRYGLDGAPFILFMGRLNVIKGPDLLLDAFNFIAHKFPELHLVFAGPDGGMLDNLQKLSQKYGLSKRIHFIGHISGSDKVSAYRDASLLVIPSRQEAMSIVVLEAGIVGTPVLLTTCCGFDEVGMVGGGGVVEATVGGLAQGLDTLLSDPTSLKMKGHRLQLYVEKQFTWKNIREHFRTMYLRILTRSSER